MAVSYRSTQTLKADPYVIPLDLNLMGRVLSIKQQKFDENAKSIQQGINQLGATDILKSQDKDYLNQKINKLVTDLNGFGGVDLSDANNFNQIQSMGGDIYNDDAVINAISGTKSVRALQKGYQEYKTNPKLSKLYSVANEYNDNLAVNAYMSDDKVGASYGGSSTPTPYVNYKENLLKNIQGVKASLKQSYTPNGDLIYINEENKEIKPEMIAQMAKDLSTPDEVAQMGRDGVYQFRNLDPNTLVTKALELHNQKLNSAAATLDRYTSLYLQASDDPAGKAKYKGLMEQQKAELNSLQNVKADDFVNKYKENPLEFTKNTYMDEFYRGIGNRFAYSETKRTVVPNTAALANLKLAQAERFHNDVMDLGYFNAGVKLINGKLVKDDAKTLLTEFSTLPSNTQDPSAIPTGEAALQLKNQDLVNKNTEVMSNFISSWVIANPELREILPSSQSATGMVATVKGHEFLEMNNGTPGLQIEDFNLKQGSDNYNKAIQKGITPKQAELLNGLFTTYEQLATGVDKGVKDLPEGFAQAVEDKQLNDAAIKANNNKISSINKSLQAKYGITPNEQEVVETFDKLKAKDDKDFATYKSILSKDSGFLSSITNSLSAEVVRGLSDFIGVFSGNQRAALSYLDANIGNYLSAKRKIDNTNYKQDKKAFYDQIENRVQFEQPILKDNENLQKLFSDNLSTIGSADNSVAAGEVVAKAKNVELIKAGRSSDGTGGYEMTGLVTSPDGKNVNTYTVKLSPQQALQVGFNSSPYGAINDEVNLEGFSTPKLISAQVNPSLPNRAPLRAKVEIQRVFPQSNNDFSSRAVLLDEHGNKICVIPNTKRARPDEAYAASKGALQQAENYGFTRQQMIDFFIQNKNK